MIQKRKAKNLCVTYPNLSEGKSIHTPHKLERTHKSIMHTFMDSSLDRRNAPTQKVKYFNLQPLLYHFYSSVSNDKPACASRLYTKN